jgi:potassium efflux system protein
VPNKQFITGKVLNWTLSTEVNRKIITVGVAYGTDVTRAMTLLTEVARAHPDILGDPAPFASFEEFGDSSLVLRLRVYMATLERRLGITSELYQAIYERFDQAGIVMAFPQLDVHLDPATIASGAADGPARP